MRILQLCPKVPWPPDDGGRVAMRILGLSLVRAGAEVRSLSLNPLKHRVDPCDLPDEARGVRLTSVDVDTSVSVAGALKSFLLGSAYIVDRFYSPAFARTLSQVVRAEPPDVVLLESLFMVPYLPTLRSTTSVPVVLRSLNVEHEIWRGLAAGERGLARRLYLGHLGRRLRALEIDVLEDVDAIVPVTPGDAETFRALGATVPMHVSPVGIETGLFPDRSANGEPRTLVFLGSLDWQPNLEALEWFLRTVWPLVRRAVPDARFHIAGSNPPAGLAELPRDEGVRFLGYVSDAQEFISSGRAMVVPLLSGGGIRVKILEAMALGVPVVSTRLGAAGIGARDGEQILLADRPDDMASACVSLLSDRNRARAAGQAGRSHVQEAFDSDGISRRLLEFLRITFRLSA